MIKSTAKKILSQVFGYSEFRNLQEPVIENICNKNDTLVIMPTGGGKSLCYQIPALMFEGLTIVVSPLISLMKDQVEQLRELRVSCAILNSSLSYDDYRNNMSMVCAGRAKLLYLAPETLMKSNIINMLMGVSIDCLTIDEAHCISEWGHDFRPEYRQLIEVRKRFPKAVCVALTATATKTVQKDIKNSLGFRDENEFIDSYDRKNLFIRIEPKINTIDQAITFIRQFPGQSGIVYCATRKQVDDLYVILESKNYSVKPYHAGLSEIDRNRNQDLFIRDDIQIIVATVAFGMGIDKPNVRFVLHFDMPKNIETYYQEIGRAGRDGLRSHCLMLHGYGDIKKIEYFIDQKSKSEQSVAKMHLQEIRKFVNSLECRRKPLLAYFGETYAHSSCDMCDNCVQDSDAKQDITVLAQKFLSCVKRTEERFGPYHIISVLRGSKDKKVMRFNHQNLSTYGIGMELSREQWKDMAHQLLQQNLMIQDPKHGSLSITEKAWKVFRGDEIVLGRVLDIKPKGLTKEPVAQKETQLEYDPDLFQQLRARRKKLADEAEVPPYVIFSDNTLIEMATYFPQSSKQLLNIHGVGEVRLERYGDAFLGIIRNYCSANNILEKKKPNYSTPAPRKSISSRAIEIGQLFNKGQSIDDLQMAFSIKKGTIIGHLNTCIENDFALDIKNIMAASSLSTEMQNRVLNLFDKIGYEKLKPIFLELDGTVDYDELHLMRMYYLSTR
ncbi:MAG: ATP-dependent DNA helicase recQ [Candidatus Magnetoglobus multicellularis str. Araruama]|uniref:DNA helicase RecQ n=1 Tax=Candidatus Magnetoglobus multicellularis str. Araruama TaxID=890399 RepID=A0A1V1PI41_9BACT|nr:MAG: ATP-dependent DNA helicase recQ [Candidatus Magnetoglobus multicellularis str. Araruama]